MSTRELAIILNEANGMRVEEGNLSSNGKYFWTDDELFFTLGGRSQVTFEQTGITGKKSRGAFLFHAGSSLAPNLQNEPSQGFYNPLTDKLSLQQLRAMGIEAQSDASARAQSVLKSVKVTFNDLLKSVKLYHLIAFADVIMAILLVVRVWY